MPKLKELKWTFSILLALVALNLMPLVCDATQLLLHSAHYKFSPKHLSNFTLHMLNGTVQMDANIIRSLEPGLMARVDVQLRLNNSKRYQTLLTYELDVCSTIIALKTTLFKRWYKSFLKYSNFMENCPIYKGHYYLHDWRIDPALVPSYLYPGDYRIRAYLFYGKYKSKKEDFVLDCEVDAKLF